VQNQETTMASKYGDWTRGEDEALLNKLGRTETARRMLRQGFKIVFTTIINWLGNITLPFTTTKFVASEKFVLNTTDSSKTKISYLDRDFKSWFLGKTEEPIGEVNLRYGVMTELANSRRIVEDLGGEEKSETTLTEMFALMEKQGQGEKGDLLNNGWANIFYIKDNTGVLRTVRVFWYVGGWFVGANSVENPFGWSVGYQVFSRNSLESLETSVPAQA